MIIFALKVGTHVFSQVYPFTVINLECHLPSDAIKKFDSKKRIFPA